MIVLFFILFFSYLNSVNFFTGIINQKIGEVYLGTVHYYEDYFFYLNHFFQGAHDAWLTVNRYTTEATTASILFWPNVLLGKLGSLIGLGPNISYNVSVILLSIAILWTVYTLMRKIFPTDQGKALLGFLFATTATSFMNHIWVDGKPMWYPFQLWKTPNFALDRLGGVPHQLVQTLLFLLLIYAWFFLRKKTTLTLLVLLTSLNPVMAALFLAPAWATASIQKSKQTFFHLLLLSFGFLLTTYFYLGLTNLQPHIQSKLWEAGEQLTTTPIFLLLSIGPVSILGILGVFQAIGERKPIMLFGIILLAASYFLFFTDIPRFLGISNSRVLFPALYLFWGILAAEGVYVLFPLKFLLYSLLSFYFLLTLPSFIWEVGQKLVVKPEERIPLLYLPTSVYDGFTHLAQLGSYDDIVLANSTSHMDAMVPALTGHTSYTGHPFATINSDEKKAASSQFFRVRMTPDQARLWLSQRNIRYIFFTGFDGDKRQLQKAYPFLKPAYTTDNVSIYSL